MVIRQRILYPIVLVMFLLSTGCMRIPPEVKAELSSPDGIRPNNYAGVIKPVKKSETNSPRTGTTVNESGPLKSNTSK
ncbi:hypothetical protein ACFL17_00505 [Pseudomonadota bacterium]